MKERRKKMLASMMDWALLLSFLAGLPCQVAGGSRTEELELISATIGKDITNRASVNDPFLYKFKWPGKFGRINVQNLKLKKTYPNLQMQNLQILSGSGHKLWKTVVHTSHCL